MKYTYFIMTPGVDPESYVHSDQNNAHNYNYIKFGDTTNPNRKDIRDGYTTHNPDIGIFASFTDELKTQRLGTIIKQGILEHASHTCHLIQNTEWFAVDHDRAYRLCNYCLGNDQLAIDENNVEELYDGIMTILTT